MERNDKIWRKTCCSCHNRRFVHPIPYMTYQNIHLFSSELIPLVCYSCLPFGHHSRTFHLHICLEYSFRGIVFQYWLLSRSAKIVKILQMCWNSVMIFSILSVGNSSRNQIKFTSHSTNSTESQFPNTPKKWLPNI